MVAIILAAGYATRLYPYTRNMPKPLLPIGGKPLIDYIVESLTELPNIEKIVVVSNGKFFGHFEDWRENTGNPLITVLNDNTYTVDDRRGAIGDIHFAVKKENITGELVVIAGDNLFTYSIKEYYDYFKKANSDCVCVKELTDRSELSQFGVCTIDENQKVTGFFEKSDNPPSNTVAFATYMFKPQTLTLIGEYLNSANKNDAPGYFIDWLYKKTDVYAYIIKEECYDIGTVAAYEHIRDNFRAV